MRPSLKEAMKNFEFVEKLLENPVRTYGSKATGQLFEFLIANPNKQVEITTLLGLHTGTHLIDDIVFLIASNHLSPSSRIERTIPHLIRSFVGYAERTINQFYPQDPDEKLKQILKLSIQQIIEHCITTISEIPHTPEQIYIIDRAEALDIDTLHHLDIHKSSRLLTFFIKVIETGDKSELLGDIKGLKQLAARI